MRSALDFVHQLIPENIDLAIDATVGRGRDSLILARRSKRLIGFEIQKEALEEAKLLLKDYNVRLYKDCHSQMDLYVKEKVDLIIFNLGYLPRGDKRICTRAETTQLAIKKGLELLHTGGRILIVAYKHPKGQDEIKMLENLDLPQNQADIFRLTHYNGKNHPPEAWVIIKK